MCGAVAFALTRAGESEPWLAKAVTSEPDVVWDWLVPGSDEDAFAHVVAAGDDALVGHWSDGSTHVTALDSEGKELWEIEPDHEVWLHSVLFRTRRMFVMRPYEAEAGAGIEARSTEKATRVVVSGRKRHALTDAGVLFTRGERRRRTTRDRDLGLLDTETGEVIWGSDADSWVVEGDVVYVTDQGEAAKS